MSENKDKKSLTPIHGILDLPPLNIPENLFDDKKRETIIDDLKEKTGELYKETQKNAKELYENTYWKRKIEDKEEFLYISRISSDLTEGFATLFHYSDFQLYMVRKSFILSKTEKYESISKEEFEDNLLGIIKHLYSPKPSQETIK